MLVSGEPASSPRARRPFLSKTICSDSCVKPFCDTMPMGTDLLRGMDSRAAELMLTMQPG